MKLKKALVALVCAVALVTATFLGTMAYFTDNDSVTNTFTVGKVGITLDEAKVNEDGTYVTDKTNRIQENKYHLIPGMTYIKDPTIHVDADSEDCYLFVKIENKIADIEIKGEENKSKTIAGQMETLGWKPVEGVKNLYVFAKEGEKYVISKSGNVEVFKEFTIDGESVDNTKIATFETTKENNVVIEVTAYAIQKAGFENSTPIEIWNATFGK